MKTDHYILIVIGLAVAFFFFKKKKSKIEKKIIEENKEIIKDLPPLEKQATEAILKSSDNKTLTPEVFDSLPEVVPVNIPSGEIEDKQPVTIPQEKIVPVPVTEVKNPTLTYIEDKTAMLKSPTVFRGVKGFKKSPIPDFRPMRDVAYDRDLRKNEDFR